MPMALNRRLQVSKLRTHAARAVHQDDDGQLARALGDAELAGDVAASPSLLARKSASLTVIVGMACSSVRGAMSAVDVWATAAAGSIG